MNNEYKTSDIVLAACLMCLDHPLKSISVDGKKGTFIFENISHSDVEQYDLGQARIEPRYFNNTIKQLTTSVRRMSDGSRYSG